MNGSSISPPLLLAIYCVCVLVASLAGGWVLLAIRLTHTRLQLATSFVAGLMLGVGILHLVPHAWHQARSIDLVAFWMLIGFVTLFFIQRFFHFHHHDVPDEDPEGCSGQAKDEHVNHGHVHHDHTLAGKSAGQLSWTGAALGLTLHTVIAGIALAASVEAEAHAGETGALLGVGTFLVIVLHKPFDALALGTLLAAGGWSRSWRHWVNGLFALVLPVGVLLFYLGARQFTEAHAEFLAVALAFTAGTFVCIAASDLLPELQFHSHDRIKLSLALVAGLLLAAGIGFLESSGHDHHDDHDHPPALEQVEDGH
jgi:zinc and cadmium transporter